MSRQPWWEPRAQLRRFVNDLLADELLRQRRRADPRPLGWDEALSLTEDFGVDSLELMALATALAEALHLHESGIEDYLLARRTLGDWVDVAQASLAQFSERLTFRTSGSSGTPKPCVHALAHLAQETGHWARLLAGRKRVLAAVPSHHIYGFLFTVLLPRALGLEELEVVDLRRSSPAWLAHGAREGDLVIGHPAFWAAVARTVRHLPPDVVGVTSTAPCPDSVSDALEQSGIAVLLQVYGASETGGVGWRVSHRAPYALLPHWTLRNGGLERTHTDGSSAQVEPQDRIEPVGNASFHVAGRVDAAVQVGGINVFPSRVRELLLRHPLVEDAAVRLMRPEEGHRLKAFVVTRHGAGSEVLPQLQAWIDLQLSAPERPKAIVIGRALPMTSQGKAGDWDLPDPAGASVSAREDGSP